ncbi:MAG: hypothetical protein WD468_08450 [Pirellulales bacterium]
MAGCDDVRPQRVPVSGQVLIDGQPLKYGYVRFVPKGARASGGQIDHEGRFKLGCFTSDDGAVIGAHRVEVNAGEKLGETKVRWHAPKKYSEYSSSGLAQPITEATDSLVIPLEWNGGKPFVEVVEGMEGQEESRAPRPAISSNANQN